jgi:hypothetical protein
MKKLGKKREFEKMTVNAYYCSQPCSCASGCNGACGSACAAASCSCDPYFHPDQSTLSANHYMVGSSSGEGAGSGMAAAIDQHNGTLALI